MCGGSGDGGGGGGSGGGGGDGCWLVVVVLVVVVLLVLVLVLLILTGRLAAQCLSPSTHAWARLCLLALARRGSEARAAGPQLAVARSCNDVAIDGISP